MASEEPPFKLFSSLRYDRILLSHGPNTDAWDPPAAGPSPYYLLSLHRDRLLQAATHFNWPLAVDAISGPKGFTFLLSKLDALIDQTTTTPLRVKVVLAKDGVLTVETSLTPPVVLENLFPSRLPPPEEIREKDLPKVSPLTGGALASTTLPGDPPLSNPFIVTPDTKPTTPSSISSYKTTSRAIYDDARERVKIFDFGERREVLLVSSRDGEIMEGSLTSPWLWRDGGWVTPNAESGGQIGTTRRWALEKKWGKEGVVKVGELIDGEECWLGNGVKGYQWGKIKLA